MATGQAPSSRVSPRRRSQLGHSVRVVAPHAPGAALRETQHGVEIVRARYGPDALERVGYTGALREPMRATMLAPLMLPPFLARLWSVAAREARDFRPDVVHAHWWMPGGWIASRIGLPYIVTCHGTDVRCSSRRSGGDSRRPCLLVPPL